MEKKIYNLFIDNIDEFELLGYKFVKVKNYKYIKENAYKKAQVVEHFYMNKEEVEIETVQLPEEIGEHVHTFTVKVNDKEENSFFYRDGTRLNDIILLLRFFLGSYVCEEEELGSSWSKYDGDSLEHPNLFGKTVMPNITTILETMTQQKVDSCKLNTLLHLYFEMHKAIYIDIKIAILSPIINILVDFYNKGEGNTNEEYINSLQKLKEKVTQDANYSESEREQLSISLTKMISGLGTDFTTKTVKFIQSLALISKLQDEKLEEKIGLLAQLLNALRNGIVHSGNLRASGIERKFKVAKLKEDDGTLKGKIRVFKLGTLLVENAILELLGIDSYYYQEQDIKALEEYFKEGTFRGF